MSSINCLKDCKNVDEALEFMKLAEYRARCFVNAMRRHGRSGKLEPVGWEFAERFLPHPWVREAISEGWGKELRSHLISTVKHRIMDGADYSDLDSLMPPKEWVEYARFQAARYAKGAEWQKVHRPGQDMTSFLTKLLERNRQISEAAE